jgi:hypothetical protein
VAPLLHASITLAILEVVEVEDETATATTIEVMIAPTTNAIPASTVGLTVLVLMGAVPATHVNLGIKNPPPSRT